MSAEYATVFAVKGQAYRLYGWINDSTTGNGLDISDPSVVLAANISKDGGDGAATVATPQKVTNQTGAFYVELNATEMDAYHSGVVVSCNASNQMESKTSILCLDLAPITGSWWTQTIKKVEQLWRQGAGYFLFKNKRN